MKKQRRRKYPVSGANFLRKRINAGKQVNVADFRHILSDEVMTVLPGDLRIKEHEFITSAIAEIMINGFLKEGKPIKASDLAIITDPKIKRRVIEAICLHQAGKR